MRAVYVRVGLFAVLTVALVVGALLVFGGARVRHGADFETYFRDSVQGLDVGSAVRYRGVTVGQVTAIGLVNAEYGGTAAQFGADPVYRQALVRFAIDTARIGALPDPAVLVAQGLRARIAPQGLTGQSYLELDFLAGMAPQAVPWTPRNPAIPSTPSTLSQVTDGATLLLGKLAKVDIEGLARGLQGLTTDLHATLHSDRVTGAMDEARDTLHLLHTALEQADLPGLAGDVRQTLATIRVLAQGPQTRDLLRAATVAADRLTVATARLPQLLATLQTVASRADGGAADVQAQLTPLLRDSRAAVAALRETAEALRQSPAQAVLQGPPPRGLPR